MRRRDPDTRLQQYVFTLRRNGDAVPAPIEHESQPTLSAYWSKFVTSQVRLEKRLRARIKAALVSYHEHHFGDRTCHRLSNYCAEAARNCARVIFRIPLVEKIVPVDTRRIRETTLDEIHLLTTEREALTMSGSVSWRICAPRLYHRSVRSELARAEQRIQLALTSVLRETLALGSNPPPAEQLQTSAR
jgi:hypothetical protein